MTELYISSPLMVCWLLRKNFISSVFVILHERALHLDDQTEPSFAESIRIVEHPSNQEQKEGSRVEFKCKVHGKKKVSYQWLKEGTEMQGQNGSSLVLDPVKLRDFGCYACKVKGADGSDCVESSPATLDVTPRDGMSKYFGLLRSRIPMKSRTVIYCC